ncbi:hypothetical protein TcasGA2_TC016263 [Tribolium castaneum]|uniref:Uncharacterized protein n=1 Tax=Tribolium castaneum TaxID=7070 RepID=D6X2X5_TRICA|nr:hypothetical protein TcasGA2_TC016263 [Tribolium castaneum]
MPRRRYRGIKLRNIKTLIKIFYQVDEAEWKLFPAPSWKEKRKYYFSYRTMPLLNALTQRKR